MSKKIAWITDQHFGVRGASDIFADYQQRFYERQFFPTLREKNIEVVINGGDTFETRKYTNHYTLHRAKEMFFDPLKNMGVHMDVLIGNHDIYYRNRNDVNAPELMLREYDNIRCYDTPTTVNIYGKDVHLIPWINNRNYSDIMTFIKNSPPSLMCGHFDIAGFAMHKGGKVSDHGLDRNIFKKFPLVLSGHYHTQSKSGNIHYTGNPFEFTWSDYNDPRGFWIIDLETYDMEFIQNTESMFYKLTYHPNTSKQFLEQDLENKYIKILLLPDTDLYSFENWLDDLRAKNPAEIVVVKTSEELSSNLTEEEILEKALSTEQVIEQFVSELESVDTETKSRINTLMQELYTDSIKI